MIGIDLFSGAGGLSLGAQLAGIDILTAVESDANACKTYSRNFPNVKLLENDIRDVSKINFDDFNEQKIVFGGIPCQGFSTSNSYGTLITKPEWKYSPSRSNDIAYIRNQTNRKVKVKFDSNCDDMQLIINLTVTSGTGIGTLCNYVIMNYEDMQEVTLTLDGSIPGTVDERQFTWKWEIYAITNESGYCSATDINYTTHTFYTVLSTPKYPETEPQTNILGYACDWAGGNSDEDDVCEDILENGFDQHYTWSGTCDELSSDFVRLVAALGITATLHQWVASQAFIGDMMSMRTKTIDPVGPYGVEGIYEWVFHQWAEAVSSQRDPSANVSKPGNWGGYEDALFTHYKRWASAYVYVWDYNVPGQVSGCEVVPHARHITPAISYFRGPTR